MLFCVQREGSAHLRDRLTLRLLRSQYTAATADYLMVFTAKFATEARMALRYFLATDAVVSEVESINTDYTDQSKAIRKE